MLLDKSGSRFVRFFSNGMDCGPCCGYRLRTKPRNLKYKSKLSQKKTQTEMMGPVFVHTKKNV